MILDIGCGNGLETLVLGRKCKKIYGIDISKTYLAIAKIRAHYMKRKINSEFRLVKLENAGFKDDYFDKIFSICVLEHIRNYEVVLKEAYRVLKKGGQFILSVDSFENFEDKKLLNIHKKRYNVENYFTKKDLEPILKNIGFKKVYIYPIFKSEYAKKIITKNLKSGFNFGVFNSILKYYILKYKETEWNYGNKGIFLIIKCQK